LLSARLEDYFASEDPGEGRPEPKHRFVVSDYTESFAKTARIFFGRKVQLSEDPIWGS
jgi:hypothetical protein